MARLAMVGPVWVGHLNPMTTLGRELQRRGHEVTVLSFPEAAAGISKAGLQHHVIGENVFPLGEWERRTRELSVRQGFSAARYTILWLERIADVMLQELPRVLEGGRFDGLVMDQVCYGAECSAEAAGVPLTVACNALPVHFQPDVPVHSETWPPSTGRLSRFRNRMVQHVVVGLGKPFLNRIRRTRLARGLGWNVWHHLNEIPPSLAQVAQLPACLDFPRRHAPDHFHHTGPWHEPKATSGDGFDWSWLDDRPLIYASLGTLQNGLDHLYQLILDACRDLPMQVVLTLGRSDGYLPSRIPANAQVLGYGPQLALLKRASLVITHAGMNTTLESLTQGLPMVALPIANEQPGIAARIRHAGVGDWLPVRGLTPTKLRGAVEKVHAHARYRERATECARQIAKDGGLSRAAEIIERAVVERRRVTKW
jgi:zeaxanthin glucosyltransferase